MQADSAVHNQEGQPRDEQLTALIAQRDAMITQTSPAAITLSPAAEAKANAASLRKTAQQSATLSPAAEARAKAASLRESQQSTDLGSLAHALQRVTGHINSLKMHHDLLGNDIKALETEKQYLEEKMTVLNGSDTLSSKRTHTVAFGSTGATPFTPPRSGATTSETPPSAPPESFSDMLVRSHKRKNPYNVFKMG